MGIAILNFIIGVLFLLLAFYYAEETIWNIQTVLFTAIAAFDFGISIQLIRNHIIIQRNKK